MNLKLPHSFNIILLVLCFLKLLTAYYIPINILPGAPHDDTLFYDLATNISKFNWLGEFSGVSHIKGPIYPLFMSLSLTTAIPYRVVEAILICYSAYYLIITIKDYINSNILLIITFILLIFYPLQYGTVDFRMLRDMIYPQLTLLVVLSIFNCIKYSDYNFTDNKKVNFHIKVFGLSFFSFVYTREETIWILPFFVFILFSSFFIVSNKINLFKSLIKGIFIFLGCYLLLHILTFINVRSIESNIFKSSGFQSGYASMHKIKRERKLLEGLSLNDINTLSSISISFNKLNPYFKSDRYKGWIETACFAHKSQGKNIEIDTNCPFEMPAAFLMFALIDALYDLGLRNPDEYSTFMQKISDEIEIACTDGKIICQTGAVHMMPPQLFQLDFSLNALIQKVILSSTIIINFENPKYENIIPPTNIVSISKIQTALRSYIFSQKEFSPDVDLSYIQKNYNVSDQIVGVVDAYSDQITNGTISGWAFKTIKFDKIVIFNDERKIVNICDIKINRPDINLSSPSEIGFICRIPKDYNEYKMTFFYAYKKEFNTLYKLDVVDYVGYSIRGEYNKNCYLKYNPDVSTAVQQGKIDAYNHWFYYSVNEVRRCGRLLNKADFDKNNLLINKTELDISFNKYFFELTSSVYHFICKFLLYAIFLFYLLYFFSSKSFSTKFLILNLSISVLIISRILLISLLDVVGMAPVSGLYLSSAIYLYFVLGLISFMYLLNNYIFVGFKFDAQRS
jgi:hypothetical protein